MTTEEAGTVRIGDTLITEGRICQVVGIQTSGIAAPMFRLVALDDGPRVGRTSYVLCRFPTQQQMQAAAEQ